MQCGGSSGSRSAERAVTGVDRGRVELLFEPVGLVEDDDARRTVVLPEAFEQFVVRGRLGVDVGGPESFREMGHFCVPILDFSGNEAGPVDFEYAEELD